MNNHFISSATPPPSSHINPKQEPHCESPSSSSRKRPRVVSKPREEIQRERDRRVTMNQLFATLKSMLPSIQSKVTRTTIVSETIEYIKLLEGVVGKLEDRKKSIQGGGRTSYTSQDSNVSIVASGEMAVFGICLDVGRCLVAKALMVFEEHNVEVLAANVAVDGGVVKLTVTAFVSGGRREVMEVIKGEILRLMCCSFG